MWYNKKEDCLLFTFMSVEIAKNDLKKLYESKKMTTYQIADFYNCCQATVWKRLHKFKIKPRFYRVDLPENKLRNLYTKNKLSTWMIERKYGYCRGTIYRKLYEYGILRRTISESHIVYPRKNFNESLIKKAYLIGFAMGDLRVRRKGLKSETINVGCGSTKKEQINLIIKLFKSYGKIWVGKPNKIRVINIECYLNNSFKFLLKKRTLADNWIGKNKKCFYSFIAGFSDAEGCFSISSKGIGYYALGNYNKKLLNQVRNFLEKNEINCAKIVESRIKGRMCFKKYFHNQNYWHFKISKKKALLRFFDLIGIYLRHEARIRDMDRIRKNIIKRNKIFGNLKMN